MAKNSQIRDKHGLTPRQKMFCDLYIADPFHPAEAATKAGYSERTAINSYEKILRVGAVSRYIAERMPAADEERARKAKERIATGDEVTAFLSDVMRGQVKDAFGLDAGLSDRISAAKELRRIYDVIDKARASGTLQDDLSKSLAQFANGEWIDPDEDEDQTTGRGHNRGGSAPLEQSQEMEGSPSVVDTDPTPTPDENISLSTDNKTQLPRESEDSQNSDPQKNFENPITGG